MESSFSVILAFVLANILITTVTVFIWIKVQKGVDSLCNLINKNNVSMEQSNKEVIRILLEKEQEYKNKIQLLEQQLAGHFKRYGEQLAVQAENERKSMEFISDKLDYLTSEAEIE